MEPTEKGLTIDCILSALAGKDRRKTIEADACVTCDATDLKFKDALSVKEYRISGMCQECQDKVWG